MIPIEPVEPFKPDKELLQSHLETLQIVLNVVNDGTLHVRYVRGGEAFHMDLTTDDVLTAAYRELCDRIENAQALLNKANEQ